MKVSTEMIMGCKNPLCFIFSVTHVLVMCLAFLKAVTPANFLAVLTGDAAKVTGGSGKVLKRQVPQGSPIWAKIFTGCAPADFC